VKDHFHRPGIAGTTDQLVASPDPLREQTSAKHIGAQYRISL
jgi:hypothetical protein